MTLNNAHCYSSTPFSGMVDRTFSCLFMLSWWCHYFWGCLALDCGPGGPRFWPPLCNRDFLSASGCTQSCPL